MSHDIAHTRKRRIAGTLVSPLRRRCTMIESPPKNRRTELLRKIAAMIVEAKDLHLTDTAFLLNVVHLDLQTKINNISASELQAFTEHIRSRIED